MGSSISVFSNLYVIFLYSLYFWSFYSIVYMVASHYSIFFISMPILLYSLLGGPFFSNIDPLFSILVTQPSRPSVLTTLVIHTY